MIGIALQLNAPTPAFDTCLQGIHARRSAHWLGMEPNRHGLPRFYYGQRIPALCNLLLCLYPDFNSSILLPALLSIVGGNWKIGTKASHLTRLKPSLFELTFY